MFLNDIYYVVGILYKNGFCDTLNYINVFCLYLHMDLFYVAFLYNF
jgi:hypothetical protein